MPGADSVQISLSDALQVNGKPLEEEELWSVLCQSSEAIQDVFFKGQALAEDGPNFVVSPYTLLLCPDGRVTFTESIDTTVPDLRNFIPPEGLVGINIFSEPVVEKMYIYALGQTLVWCSEFNRLMSNGITMSHHLQSVMATMCNPHPDKRIGLVHILEACALHAQHTRNGVPYSHHVARLNKIILGSITELDRIGQDEDHYYGNSNTKHNVEMDHRQFFEREPYQKSNPDLSKPPIPSRSPQKRPRSSSRRSNRRDHDEPDMLERSRGQPLQARDVSHYSSSTADSRDSVENLLPRKRSHLQQSSYLSEDDEDEGRSYHLSDIVSSPSMAGVSQQSKKSNNSLQKNSRSPSHRGRDSQQSRSSQVYERLRERREKLSLLREQLGINHPNPPPAFPAYHSESEAVNSDVEDIKKNIRELRRKGRSAKSLVSMESAQEGSFHPGQLSVSSSMPSINAAFDEPNRHPRLHSPHDLERGPAWSDKRLRDPEDGIPQKGGGFSDQRQEAKKSRKKLKKFFGPEFVIMSSAPNETIDMVPSMLCKAGKIPPDRKQITVVLLNGKRLDLMCDLGTSGQELFEIVASHLQLTEKSYFGLAYIKDGEYMFLEPDAKIYKVGPEAWRAEAKKATSHSTISREKFTLFFRVKFYVDNVNVLKNLEDQARHNFYLQLRRDVLEERIRCKEPEALQLASLALQVEMGKYDHNGMSQNYFLPEHYIPAGIIESMGVTPIRRKLPVLHQEHEDMSEEDAEFEYLLEARKLSEYGIHFHKVAKSKKSSKQAVWLGICARGIIVYDKNGTRRSQIHAHPWPMTKKVAFKRKKFIIEPNDSTGCKFIHYTDNYKKGKYLLQLCKVQHKFHMTMRNKAQISQRFHEEFPSPVKYSSPQVETEFGYDVHFSDDEDENYDDDDYGEEYDPPIRRQDASPNRSEPVLNVLREKNSHHPHRRPQSHMEMRVGETLPSRGRRGQKVPGQNSHLTKARSVDTGRQILEEDDDPLLGRGRPLRSQVRSHPREYDSFSENYSSQEEEMDVGPRREPSRQPSRQEILSRERLSPTWPEVQNEEEVEGPYATIDSIIQKKRESQNQNSTLNSKSHSHGAVDKPYVVDASIHTKEQSYRKQADGPSPNDTLSETLQARLGNMQAPDVPERDIVIVTLKKDPIHGLGLTIVGGENSGSLDLGIFVKEVTEEGPAGRDGRIYPGDRIISINGQSLEGVSHRAAVDIIQRTSDVVQLILSQPRRNRKGQIPKPSKSETLQETPYANIDEVRRQSSQLRPKLPPDRKPHRSDSLVSASGSISKQTPPTKPRRKPQSFGSSYSLVNSDSEAALSETERNVRHKGKPSLSGTEKEHTSSDVRQYNQMASDAQKVPPSDHESTKSSPRISTTLPRENGEHLQEIGQPSEPQDEVLSDSFQSLQSLKETKPREANEIGKDDTKSKQNVIRGFSPTLDMDFDDDFSDDVPTPESSEMEDLFGDLDGKEKKPEINLRRSINKSPLLSSETGRDDGKEKEGDDVLNGGEEGVGDASGKKIGYDGEEEEELVASALKPGDKFTVELKKKNSSLGVSVTGGINTSVRLGGIYVKTMVPGGAAEEEGQIRPGDRILQVDKYSLQNVTHKQAVEILRQVPEVSVLQMERGQPPAKVNTLPPTPVDFNQTGAETLEEGVTTESENVLNTIPPKKLHNQDTMDRQAAASNREDEFVSDDLTERFSPPPRESNDEDGFRSESPVNTNNQLRVSAPSPRATTPTIEALDDEEEESVSEEVDEGVSQSEEDEGSHNYQSNEASESEVTDSDVPSDDFPEDDDLYAEIASPALSTREADTLTPTAHLVTPTRGIFGVRGQGGVPAHRNWVYRKSIDDDDRYSSAVSESARSPSPSSSFHPEDESNFKPGFQAFRRPSDSQGSDMETTSIRKVMRSPHDGSRKTLEIEPSILPVMEEEPAEFDGPSAANAGNATIPNDNQQGPGAKGEVEEPSSHSPLHEANDQSSYQPTMVTMDSNLMSPMSTMDSVGALTLTQTILQDPDASTDIELPDVPYATPENCFEVELNKGNQGLGFSVQGGVGAHKDPRLCTVRIKKIFPGQSAAQSGLVEEGDIILAVNGEHVYNSNHSDVVAKLRTSPQTVRLLICRPTQEELNTLLNQPHETKKSPVKGGAYAKKDPLSTLNSSISNMTSPFSTPPLSPTEKTLPQDSSIDFGSNEVLSISESSPRRNILNDDVIEVTLVKPVRGGLGFTVAGGVNTGGCYIKDIITDPALSDGRLKKGDKILSVNGKDMQSMNHFEAVTFLRMTPREVTLRVKRPVNRYDLASPSPEKQAASVVRSPPSSPTIATQRTDPLSPKSNLKDEVNESLNKSVNIQEGPPEMPSVEKTPALDEELFDHPIITLRRNNKRELGLRVTVDSRRDGSSIYIGQVVFGSPAQLDGSIEAGDELKSINGVPLSSISLKQAQKMLEDGGEVVKLKVSRKGVPVHPVTKSETTAASHQLLASSKDIESHQKEQLMSSSVVKQTNDDMAVSKRNMEDSDIDLGDLSAEDSDWEDMSSESENNSDGELDDLDDILAALDPVHGSSSKPVVKDEAKSKTTRKETSPPPSRNVISQQEEEMKESVSLEAGDKTEEEPPPVPDAPLPPMTPTSDHSVTPPISPPPENIPPPVRIESVEKEERHDSEPDHSLKSDVERMSLQDRGQKEAEKDQENEETSRGTEKLGDEEDEVEQSVLNDILNQEDSFDDITFADMLSSGDEEESDMSQIEEEEDDDLDRVEDVDKNGEGDEQEEGQTAKAEDELTPKTEARHSSETTAIAQPLLKQNLTNSPLTVVPPSPVMVTTPSLGEQNSSQRMETPSPGDDLSSTPSSDSEESLSLMLPSLGEDKPRQNKSLDFPNPMKVEKPLLKQTPEYSVAEEKPLQRHSVDLSESVDSQLTVSGEFSFSDALLPMPSSPSVSSSPASDQRNVTPKGHDQQMTAIGDHSPVTNPDSRSPVDDKSDNVPVSPRGKETPGVPNETPANVLSVRSPETPSESVSFSDALPPLPEKPTLSKLDKMDSSSPSTLNDVVLRRPPLPVEARELLGEGDSVTQGRRTPLKRPPSTVSEGFSASEGGVYWVELEKPTTGGLGLSVVGAEKGGKTSVFIKTVTPGGVTDADGRIKVGDKVLQVNGLSTVGMTQSKVVSLLRKAQGTVKLALASGKPSSRPSSIVGMDRGADTDQEPVVPPLNLPQDLGQSESDSEREEEEEVSQTESFTESARDEGSSKRAGKQRPSLSEPDPMVTSVTFDSSLAQSLSFENLHSLSLITPPPPEFGVPDWPDRDTDSDIDSTADLPDDSLLDLLDDSGNAVTMETAIRATRQIGRVLKDKFQGKDDDSLGSDIGFPLSSGGNSPVASDGEQSSRSARGRQAANGAHPMVTDKELEKMKILQVPVGSKLYSGKSLKTIISDLQKKIDKHDPEEEFKMLRQVKAVDSCEVARKVENRDKNRFRNVLPYDKTRVVLQNGDYVNASHVQVQVKSTEYHYIACQGPLPQTTKDFWQMIWEQGVEVIAMVTLDFENGKVKCHKYWPDSEDAVVTMDSLEIRLVKSKKLDHFHVRQLTMKDVKSNEVHHVTHLNFTSWPDHSVPNSGMPLLRYARYTRKLCGDVNPVVIHCSAGIGRTGTLITIDLLLAMIENDQEIKIADIVKNLRLQRQGMIQTKDQYLFCYKAAVEALKTL